MSEITLVQEFAASAEQVFAAIADQDTMASWVGAKVSVPTRGPNGPDGKPGLVGTVRRVHVGPLTFDERIVESEAPRLLAYQLCTPLPLLQYHRGEMRVDSLGEGRSRLTWHIVLRLAPGFMGGVVLAFLGVILRSALGRLARRLTR